MSLSGWLRNAVLRFLKVDGLVSQVTNLKKQVVALGSLVSELSTEIEANRKALDERSRVYSDELTETESRMVMRMASTEEILNSRQPELATSDTDVASGGHMPWTERRAQREKEAYNPAKWTAVALKEHGKKKVAKEI